MKNLKLDSYIETKYYQVKGASGPIDVTEFNMAFAANPFYNSGSPLARHGSHDLMVIPKDRPDIDYSCAFINNLIDLDRQIVTDRVIFYSLMRAYLPSFALIDTEWNEHKISAFASFYSDGLFSITHVYEGLKLDFKENCLEKIYNWDAVLGIKIDAITGKLLKLSPPEEAGGSWDNVDYAALHYDEFMEIFSEDKFSMEKEIVLRILEENSKKIIGGNWDSSLTIRAYHTPYSYLALRCNCEIDEVDFRSIGNVLSRRGDTSFVNELLYDMGVDLTSAPNTLARGYRNYFYSVHKTEEEILPGVLIFMFNLFDASIVEKIKYMYSIKEIRDIVYYPKSSNADVNKLLDIRYHQLTTVNDGYCYEYQDALLLTVKAIRQSLGIDDYKNEYEYFCRIAEELIIKHTSLRQQEESNRQTNALNILTFILTIPSVIGLVDLFYSLEVRTIFIYPVGNAKLLWTGLSLVVSVCLIYKKKIHNLIVSLFKKEKKRFLLQVFKQDDVKKSS